MNTVQVALLSAALVATSYLLGGRYEVATYGDKVVILDAFTGDAKTCQHIVGCFKLEDND